MITFHILTIGIAFCLGISNAVHWKDWKETIDLQDIVSGMKTKVRTQFSRRINAFHGGHRRDPRQRLPNDLIQYVAEYMYYDWSTLLEVFRDTPQTRSLQSTRQLREHIIRCTEGEGIGLPNMERCGVLCPNPIIVDNAGNIIRMNLHFQAFGDCAIGDLSKLPPTLKRLNLSGNLLTSIDTKALPRGLEWLCLAINRIQYFDMKGLPKGLKRLNLKGNPYKLTRNFSRSDLPPNLEQFCLTL